MKKYTFACLSYNEQRAISHFLGSLDGKIELNSRVKTLEAATREILKSWFMDFDSVCVKSESGDPALPEDIVALFPDSFEDLELGEIPTGWKLRSLSASEKYIICSAFRNFHFIDEEGALPVVKIAELKNGVTGQTKFTMTGLDDKYSIDDGEILLSWSDNPETSIGTFVWCGEASLAEPTYIPCSSTSRNRKLFRILPFEIPAASLC